MADSEGVIESDDGEDGESCWVWAVARQAQPRAGEED